MTLGSLATLETNPAEMGINVGLRLIKFFKERYQPSKAKFGYSLTKLFVL
jgi:hypothetical protein